MDPKSPSHPDTRTTHVSSMEDPGSFLVNHFWGRRPDGLAINEDLKIAYVLEYKLSTDRDEGFVEVKEAKANEQRKSIIVALKAAAPK